MRRLLIGLSLALCFSLAAGPVLAQPKKAAHHKKAKKEKKGKKGKKAPKPAPQEKPSSIFAQKGTWTLSGEGALRVDWKKGDVSGKKDWTGPITMRVASVVSYFVIDGLELRVGPAFRYIKTHVKKAPDVYSISGGALLGLYYNHNLAGTLFLTAGADAHLLGGKTTTENSAIESKTFDWFLGPRLGITLAFGGRYGGFFRVLGFFDYGGRKYTTEPGGAEADDDILNFGVQTALGLFF